MARSIRAIAVLLVAGASATTAASGATPAVAAERQPVRVVAAFYPLAFAAQHVGRGFVSVSNLTPPGAEPHDLELTTKQRDAIQDADVVLVMGAGFQPAVEKVSRDRSSGTVNLLSRLPIGAGNKKVAAEGTDDPNALDPHVWLDPSLMRAIVDVVASSLAKADRRHAASYEANATRLDEKLQALDQRFRDGLADCDRRLLLTSHEAFGYLAKAYGLRQEGVAGLSPDQEPNPRRLDQLTDLAKREGATTIFTEELVSPKIAQTLAREAGGLRTEVLSPLEGLTAKEIGAGDSYITVMDRNLSRLRAALACR
jgi:zinc transport system substrate-binding protein